MVLILAYNVFIVDTINITNILIILIFFICANVLVFKYRRPDKRLVKDITTIISGMSVALIGLFYAVGFMTGFSANYSVIFRRYIATSTWMITFAIVIVEELLRYIMADIDDRNKKRYFLINFVMLLAYVLIDLSIATKTYDLTSFNQFYEFFALVLVQSIAKNIFLIYVSKKSGYVPCLVYRLIVDLYIYFIPIVPKINIFIEAVVLLLFPYMVYMVMRNTLERRKLEPARKNKKLDRFVTTVTAIVFAIVVMLVSREFTYAMIAIGSESMTGTVNKGDAVIYKKYNQDVDKLEAGDIIVFEKNGRIIVHRIDSVYKMDGEQAYRTKGDANNAPDNWIVLEDNIVGIVKARVILIAWPSVLLNELF